MKSKKYFYVFLIVLVAAAFVVPVAMARGETPPKIEDFDYLAQILIGIVTLAVTYGIKSIAEQWGFDLSGKASQITAAIVGFFFETVNTFLAMMPPAYYPVFVSGVGFLTALLIAYGVASRLNKFTKKDVPVLPK